jgi:hypothetical protein
MGMERGGSNADDEEVVDASRLVANESHEQP